MKELKKGVFIVFEGGDGVGKSTQIEKAEQYIQNKGFPLFVTYEPYDPEHRKRIEEEQARKLTPEEELDIFCEDRVNHVRDKIRPHVEKNIIVFSSRYRDSTVAYQGYARGLAINVVRKRAHESQDGVEPDLVLVYDLPAEEGLRRLQKRKQKMDRIEKEKVDFHERVRQGFIQEAEWHHTHRSPTSYKIIDASLSEEKVWQKTKKCIDAFFLRELDIEL
ncbi:MAG: dTMP kinase [bacterium]|nr:dTMP kinase [bacterium]